MNILERVRNKLEGEYGGPLSLSPPPSHIPADLSLNFPLAIAKRLGEKPLEMAQKTAGGLSGWPEFEKVEVSPPGFVNATLSTALLIENLDGLVKNPEHYGKSENLPQDPILIEFVSANPTGPLHLASGRGACLGDCLARILRHLGYCVQTEYYINDMGRQAQLLGQSLRARFLGQDPPQEGYRGDYVTVTAQGLGATSQWSDEDFRQKGIESYVQGHREDMEAFGVQFDRWFTESSLYQQKALDQVLQELSRKNRTYEKEGAVWFEERVLRRKDGRPTYFLSDIAYHKAKLDRGFKKLINIWGADHHGYVSRMQAALAALGYPPETLQIVLHQIVHLYRGKQQIKMSKREGEMVTLREVLEEVGVDGCRWFFATKSPQAHLNFDLELAKKKSQENPVYYVQYVHARICSIFRQGQEAGLRAPFAELRAPAGHPEGTSVPAVPDWTPQPEERVLLAKLAWFPETLRTCVQESSPHPLAGALLDLARAFHPFYEKHRVVNPEDPKLSQARLRLCRGVQGTIALGLGFLGISAPERM